MKIVFVKNRYKYAYIDSNYPWMTGLWITSFTGLFSNQRLFTKMCILDYLQFFSQETLSAPWPQSHLHEFIDSWLVPWEKERYWVENPRASWLFPQEPLDSTPSSSPPQARFKDSQVLSQSSWWVQKMAGPKLKQWNSLLGFEQV